MLLRAARCVTARKDFEEAGHTLVTVRLTVVSGAVVCCTHVRLLKEKSEAGGGQRLIKGRFAVMLVLLPAADHAMGCTQLLLDVMLRM